MEQNKKIPRQINPTSLLYKIVVGVASSIIILSLLSLTNVVFAQRGLDSPITTTPPPAATTMTNTNFNFAAAGDWGCTDDTTDTVNNILDKSPELVLGLGDYSYEDSADCWFDIIQPINNIMKISIGNHDDEEYLREYMNHFGLTEQYYSFDYQNVHFIALATEEEYLDMSNDKAKEQLAFVKSDLEEASNNPNIDWIIPFFHRIMYYESEGGIVDEFDHNLVDIYHPLFEKYGVNLVLQAHTHTYERTYPLRFNSEDSEDPIITSEDSSNYRSADGLVIATVGTGGAFPTRTYFNGELAVAQYNDLFGFLNVEVSSDGKTLVGTFYANEDEDEEDEEEDDDDNGNSAEEEQQENIRDQFTITKSAESSAPLSTPSQDVPAEETDGLEEDDDRLEEDDDIIVDLDDDAVVSEDSEDVDDIIVDLDDDAVVSEDSEDVDDIDDGDGVDN